jgi:hypothetical protein
VRVALRSFRDSRVQLKEAVMQDIARPRLRSRLRLAAPLAGILILAACATATPYQPLGVGDTRGGYAEQRIEENRYRVMFAGNVYTSRERVENFLLYRAAELALQNGYDGFTIVERTTERDVETRVYRDPFGPGRFAYWRPWWRYHGLHGWSRWDPWYGDPFWADRIDVRTVDRYEAIAEIVLFRGRRPADPRSFDARQVIGNIGPTIDPPR